MSSNIYAIQTTYASENIFDFSRRIRLFLAYNNVSRICHFANLFNWLLFYEIY